MQEMAVTSERISIALRVLQDKWLWLTEEKRLMVVHEIGLYDCVSFDPAGNLVFNGSDLQIVAAAAALAAVVEAGGEVRNVY